MQEEAEMRQKYLKIYQAALKSSAVLKEFR